MADTEKCRYYPFELPSMRKYKALKPYAKSVNAQSSTMQNCTAHAVAINKLKYSLTNGKTRK